LHDFDFCVVNELVAAPVGVVICKELLNGGLQLFPPFGVDAVANRSSFDGSLDEADGFEFSEVLADGGLRQADFVHNGACDAAFAGTEIL
jgi:hypothetical protein